MDIYKNKKKYDLLWYLLSAVVFSASIYYNWNNWGRGLVQDDIHREFITPLRLLAGEVLYRDFNFVYGPMAPYLNALIIHVSPFNSFFTCRIIALSLFLSTLVLNWLICRETRKEFLWGPVLFISVCWTNIYIFNPPSFNFAYTYFFAVLAVLCAIYTLSRKSSLPWIFLGFAMAATVFSKPEGTFTAALACLAALFFHIKSFRDLFSGKIIILGFSFILLMLALTGLCYMAGISPPTLLEGVLQSRFQRNLIMGYTSQLGYFNGMRGILLIFSGLGMIGFLFLLLHILEQGYKRLALGIALGAICVICVFYGSFNRFFNAYQLLGSTFAGLSGFWWLRTQSNKSPGQAVAVLWFASFGGWLRPFVHIGALILPYRVGSSILLALIFWFCMLPYFYAVLMNKGLPVNELYKRFFFICGIISVLFFGSVGIYKNWSDIFKLDIVSFQTPYGKFSTFDIPGRTNTEIIAVRWLNKHLKSGEDLEFLEGLPMQLVTSGKLSKLPFSQLNYQVYEGDVARTIKILENSKTIKYIIIKLQNGGYHFGVQDYELADYIEDNWHRVKTFGLPESLKNCRLSEMSQDRKMKARLIEAFIIYERSQNRRKGN